MVDMTADKAIEFLNEAARFFRKRDTGGEDSAFWANVYNAENCERIVALIERLTAKPEGMTDEQLRMHAKGILLRSQKDGWLEPIIALAKRYAAAQSSLTPRQRAADKLFRAVQLCSDAMKKSITDGCTDHLDYSDDAGAFWCDALKAAEVAIASAEGKETAGGET